LPVFQRLGLTATGTAQSRGLPVPLDFELAMTQSLAIGHRPLYECPFYDILTPSYLIDD